MPPPPPQELTAGWSGKSSFSNNPLAVLPPPRFTRHRRLVAFVLPGVIAHIIWWSYAAAHPSTFDLFTDVTGAERTPNWYMCITMAFGSMIAGATSEVRLSLHGKAFAGLETHRRGHMSKGGRGLIRRGRGSRNG